MSMHQTSWESGCSRLTTYGPDCTQEKVSYGRHSAASGWRRRLAAKANKARTRWAVQIAKGKLNNFDRAFWQRLHEGAAVRLGHDPVIEDHNNAVVGLGSD